MIKTAITVGKKNGKDTVIKGPGELSEHIEFIRKLTDNGGKLKEKQKTVQYDEALVVHTVKRRKIRRRFR
jgi:hypothetical protein